MAEFLGTRDAIQCRSHHMKQLRTLKKIKKIVEFTKRKAGKDQYMVLKEELMENSPCFKKYSRLIPQETNSKKEELSTKEVGIQTNEEEMESETK